MKKIFLSTAVLLAATAAWAQPVDEKKKQETVEIEISGNKVTIEAEDLENLSSVDLNTIIKEVTTRSIQIQKQQRQLLAEVAKQEANGDISHEQAEEMRDMINDHTEESMDRIGELMEVWGESFGERMEAWGEQYEAQMEAWEAEVEARSKKGETGFVMPPLPPMPPMGATPPAPPADKKSQRIIINEDGIIVKKGENGEEPFALRFENEHDTDYTTGSDEPRSIDRTNGYFDINWGFNQQLAGGTEFINDGSEELDFWRSRVFELGFGGKTRIGNPFSKLYLKWGGEFSFNGFRLLDNNTLQTEDDEIVIQEDEGKTVDKSKYGIVYFSIPLMLQLDFSDVGEIEESFTMGIGGYGGVRLGARRVLEYSTPVYNDIREEVKNDFNTNQFRYGLMAQLGWKALKLTAKYDLNKFFKENKGPDYQVASIALGLTL